jgi:hypothetical protein
MSTRTFRSPSPHFPQVTRPLRSRLSRLETWGVQAEETESLLRSTRQQSLPFPRQRCSRGGRPRLVRFSFDGSARETLPALPFASGGTHARVDCAGRARRPDQRFAATRRISAVRSAQFPLKRRADLLFSTCSASQPTYGLLGKDLSMFSEAGFDMDKIHLKVRLFLPSLRLFLLR